MNTSHYYNSSKFYNLNNFPFEKWLNVPDTNGKYFVSNLGRVKSIYRFKKSNPYIVPQTFASKKRDYLIVGFTLNGKNINKYVHRLVAKAFIPNPENKPTVNHKKGIKKDNRASELEWATYKEQEEHSVKFGLRMVGEKHSNAILSDEDIQNILNSSKKQRDLAKIYNVSFQHISNIILRKRRKIL